jgi:methionyl-tRNA formyltransferase
MRSNLRIIVASYGSSQLQFLCDQLSGLGHTTVAYMVSRSMRPSVVPDGGLLKAVHGIVDSLPAGMGLLLPGNTDDIFEMLAGYRPDIMLVFGFNWRIPKRVLELPKLGILNVHPSILPKYRGPSPVPWAIRNGDPFFGLTIHRMIERIDAGPIIAQAGGLPLPDDVTAANVWEQTKSALPALLAEALDRAVGGEPGVPQDEDIATYAGFPPPEWFDLTWNGKRRSLHHQIRVLRFLNGGRGPLADYQGRRVRVERTSMDEAIGTRVDCADGPLWVAYSEP